MASTKALASALLLLATPAFADALLGAGVGNADTLVSEGSKLFNRKQHAKAAENFLKATRANPSLINTYVQLARSALLAKQLQRACYAYRVYLKATPDSPDRKKAANESDQCERQLKAAKGLPPDPAAKWVEVRAAFFAALEKGELLGTNGAGEQLKTLVNEGFLGPELADMGQKLGSAALAQGDAVHQRALSSEKLSGEVLKSARPLYQLASDVGASSPDTKGRMAFLDGLAELSVKDFKKAEALFVEAATGDAKNKEYQFYRALSLFQAGDKAGALKVLEAELKDDPRTAVLRTAQAVGQSPDVGAAELEKLLFTTRYPAEK